jgi:hypothetical protein
VSFEHEPLYNHLLGQEDKMTAINLADAKAQLSKLVDRVEAGDWLTSPAAANQ